MNKIKNIKNTKGMKSMKSVMIILSILIGGIFFTAFLVNSAFADPQIQVTSSVTPATISPGSDGYIQLTFTNTGTSSADTLKITGFSADPYITVSQVGVANIGALASGKSTTTLVKFSVSSSAPSGLYTIHFSIDYCSAGCNQVDSTTVVTVQAPSSLQVASIQPDTLSAGETSTLNFNLVNNGADPINNIIFTWHMPNNEILPLGVSNTQYITSLGSTSSIRIPVNVSVASSVSPGVYPLSIQLSYFDKSGSRQNVTLTIGIKIGGATDFDVGFQQYSAGTVSLSIANIGVNPATSVSVIIPPQNNFATSGAASVFIGTLNAGDFSVANFQISSRVTRNSSGPSTNPSGAPNAGSNTLTVQVSYSDTSGVRQSVQKEITLNLATFQTTGTTQRSGGFFGFTNILWIVIIVIVIAGVVLWYFKFRKKKNFLSDFIGKKFRKAEK